MEADRCDSTGIACPDAGSLLWAEDGGAGPSRFSGVLHKRRAYELWAGKLHGGLLHRYEFYDAGGGRTGFGYLLAGRF